VATAPGTTTTDLGATRRSGGLPVSVPSLSMDLSDEGLGPLTLHAMNGAGAVHLKLTAGDRAVGDMLARAGGELRRDLEAGGTTVGSLDIGHSGDLGHSGAQQSGSGPSGHAGSQAGGSQSGPNTSARHTSLPRRDGPSIRPLIQPPTARSGAVTDGVDVRI
jgi:hypothetical protein